MGSEAVTHDAPIDLEIERWRRLLQAAGRLPRPGPIPITIPLEPVGGMSRGVLVRAGKDGDFVVKGIRGWGVTGRMLFAEQVVGMIAQLVGAPVPPVALLRASPAQIQAGRLLRGLTDEVVHGSSYLQGVKDEGRGAFYKRSAENAERFARLSVLYGWADAGPPDRREFLMDRRPPHLVYSVDHGEFFRGGPRWDEASLAVDDPPPRPDRWIARMAALGGIALTPRMIEEATDCLRAATDERIASIVVTPPTSWGVGFAERVAVARYLARRRDTMLNRAAPFG
jgi:hypothetical protein